MSDSNLVTFYRDLLLSLDVEADETGALQYTDNSGFVNMTIDGVKKTLHLPTHNALSKPQDDSVVFFHPVCENQFLERSDVYNVLVQLTKAKMVQQSLLLMHELLSLSHDFNNSADLDLDLYPLLQDSSVKGKDMEQFHNKVIEHLAQNSSKLMGLKITRNGKYDGNVYKRTVALIPVLLSEIEASFDQHATDKQGNPIPNKHLMDIKAPNLRCIPDFARVAKIVLRPITGFTDSDNAPFLEALLNMLSKFAAYTNKLISQLSKGRTLANPMLKPMNVDCILLLNDFNTLCKSSGVPTTLDYNSGKGSVNNNGGNQAPSWNVAKPNYTASSEPRRPAQAPAPAPAPAPSRPAYQNQQQVSHHQQQPVNPPWEEDEPTVAELLARRQMGYNPTNHYQNAVPNHQYQQPMQPYPQQQPVNDWSVGSNFTQPQPQAYQPPQQRQLSKAEAFNMMASSNNGAGSSYSY